MAARSLNKVLLIGNLTRDPEVRYTPQGTAVCQFGLATNRDWTTSNGEKKEDVQYHQIIAWSKLAELCGQLLAKGSKIFVEGRIVYRKFTGKDGLEKNVTEIVTDNMILLASGRNAGARMSAAAAPQQAAAASNVPQQPPAASQTSDDNKTTTAGAGTSGAVEEVNDEDIPF